MANAKFHQRFRTLTRATPAIVPVAPGQISSRLATVAASARWPCVVRKLQLPLIGRPRNDGALGPAVGGSEACRAGRGSLSYTNSNRKIPAQRSSVGNDRFKPG